MGIEGKFFSQGGSGWGSMILMRLTKHISWHEILMMVFSWNWMDDRRRGKVFFSFSFFSLSFFCLSIIFFTLSSLSSSRSSLSSLLFHWNGIREIQRYWKITEQFCKKLFTSHGNIFFHPYITSSSIHSSNLKFFSPNFV